MSARTRKKRPSPSAAAGPSAASPSGGAALPKWEWRTFPVYFAFSLGGFLGLYMGLIASAANSAVQAVAFGIWAVLLGFGFSRMTSRWMMSRNWGRYAKKRQSK